MSKLLLVTSSVFGPNSKSRQIALEFIDAWRDSHPEARIVERDLQTSPIPHLDSAHLVAFATAESDRTPAQRELARADDALIREVEEADTIVLAAPMYNFSIPSTLKAWIDHIARAGRTFRYSENGPVGLLKGKRVFVVTGRGGIYSGASPSKSLDFQEPYLRAVLGFIGLDDIQFIHVEGLNITPEHAAKGIERARQAIGEFASRTPPA